MLSQIRNSIFIFVILISGFAQAQSAIDTCQTSYKAECDQYLQIGHLIHQCLLGPSIPDVNFTPALFQSQLKSEWLLVPLSTFLVSFGRILWVATSSQCCLRAETLLDSLICLPEDPLEEQQELVIRCESSGKCCVPRS